MCLGNLRNRDYDKGHYVIRFYHYVFRDRGEKANNSENISRSKAGLSHLPHFTSFGPSSMSDGPEVSHNGSILSHYRSHTEFALGIYFCVYGLIAGKTMKGFNHQSLCRRSVRFVRLGGHRCLIDGKEIAICRLVFKEQFILNNVFTTNEGNISNK